MDWLRVLLLALLQGVSELFPVSSLGHTVIIPGLLGWRETLRSPTFLPLLVALHLGTALALLTFFWHDWRDLLRGGARVVVAGRFTPEVDPKGHGRELALVIVGTIPAGLIGLLLQKPLEQGFSIPLLAAVFLALNGAVLLAGERFWGMRHAGVDGAATGATPGGRRATGHGAPSEGSAGRAAPLGEVGAGLAALGFGQAALIGLAQAGALLPGLSRSGLTMVAGLASGLSHEAAARFSFLLATPLILAAGVLEVPELFAAGRATVALAVAGGAVAGLAAYLSVRFLMRYFETNRLNPFAYYCIAVGALSGAYFLLQRWG